MSDLQVIMQEALRRLRGEVDFNMIGAGVKEKLLEQLQGMETPEEAFKLKLRLDAVDAVILEMTSLAS